MEKKLQSIRTLGYGIVPDIVVISEVREDKTDSF